MEDLQQEHNCLLEEFSKLLTEKKALISTLKEANLQPIENEYHLNKTYSGKYSHKISTSNQLNSIEKLNDDNNFVLKQENASLMQDNSSLVVAANKSQKLIADIKTENNQLYNRLKKISIEYKKTKEQNKAYKSSLMENKNHSENLQRKLTIAANSYKELLIKHKEIKKVGSNSIIIQRKKYDQERQTDEKSILQLQLQLRGLESQIEGDKKYTKEIIQSLNFQQNKTTELSKRVIELESQVHEMQRIINKKTIDNKDLMDDLITLRELSLIQSSTSPRTYNSNSYSPIRNNQNNSTSECCVEGSSLFEYSRHTPEGRHVGLYDK